MAKPYRLTGSRKAFNAVLRALIALGIPVGNTVLLITPGRRTGQPRSTPVTLLHDGARRYLVSPYGEVAWVQNARAAGRARLRYRGREEAVRLSELQAEAAAPLLKQYREK